MEEPRPLQRVYITKPSAPDPNATDNPYVPPQDNGFAPLDWLKNLYSGFDSQTMVPESVHATAPIQEPISKYLVDVATGHRETGQPELSSRIGDAAVGGLTQLGVNADYASRGVATAGHLLDLTGAPSVIDAVDAQRRNDPMGVVMGMAGMIPGTKPVAKGVKEVVRELDPVVAKVIAEHAAAKAENPRAIAGPVEAAPVDPLTVNSILHPDTPALPARSRNVEEIAKELETRGSEALKGLGVTSGKVDPANPEHAEIVSKAMASEIKAAMDRGGNTAADWYTKAIDEAMDHASAIWPQLKGDPHHKMGFTSALAVTSQGETVSSNVRLAEKAYDHFRETGRFPTNVVAKNGPAMNSNFRKLNDLLDTLGPDGMRDFLHSEYTVKELKALGHEVGGENMGTKVFGSSILGPKIGQGFYQNLNGNYNPVTMDLWFMRAMGRLTGSLVGRPMEKPTLRFRDALKEGRMSAPLDPEKLADRADKIMKLHERDYKTNRADYDSGAKSKSELTFAADRFLQNLRGINEQPSSGSHRQWMRDRVNRARELLADQGHNLSNADLQAIWWYPEKELYSKLGGRDSEAINTDYATVLRELRAKAGR